jgi:hypothetical protein
MMIETRTGWEDTGFDCDHCGGRVLKRTDYETGQPDRVCLQCEQCGCQWALDRRPLRAGHRKGCRTAQRRRQIEMLPTINYNRWLLVGIAALALLLFLRFGGAALARFVLPLVLVGIAIFILVRIGREQEWW